MTAFIAKVAKGLNLDEGSIFVPYIPRYVVLPTCTKARQVLTVLLRLSRTKVKYWCLGPGFTYVIGGV